VSYFEPEVEKLERLLSLKLEAWRVHVDNAYGSSD
jgi:hypothetical protein